MHERLERLVRYLEIGGLRAAVPLLRSTVTNSRHLARIKRLGLKHPFSIRVRTSDYLCFEQVFVQRQYALNAVWEPRTIVDAGANIGLASIYFANAFPASRIIAVEPEQENFALLEKNCEPYAEITPLLAALWHEDTNLHVCDIGNGAWGFVTRTMDEYQRQGSSGVDTVRGLSMHTLMDEFDIDEIDILKIDIEGSEKEVFAGKPDWLERVGVLIIETHDWFRPGCREVVDEAIGDFDVRWQHDENLVVAREGACIAPAQVLQQSGVTH